MARAACGVARASPCAWLLDACAPLFRIADPRWGRNIESAGEDPFLSGQYAANFIQGFEHANEVSYPLQASACCKHFVANELEATNGSTRHNIDVFVPQQDLVDSYLPSFQTCVEEGKASGIMCSACARVLRRARWRAVSTWPHPTRPSSPLISFRRRLQRRQRRAQLRQRVAARHAAARQLAV